MYLKRQEQGSDSAAQSPSLARQHVLPLPATTPTPTCTLEGNSDHVAVGSFYEIDHTQLSPVASDQLKLILVVMVCERTEVSVSLRFPSIDSLRSHFANGPRAEQDGNKLPALDEKCVMGLDSAVKVLCRRVPTQEFDDKRRLWSFWVKPTEPTERDSSPALTCGVVNVIPKAGSCLSILKHTGMTQWGKRRQVQFLARHLEEVLEPEPLSSSGKRKEETDEEEEEVVEEEGKEEEECEEEEGEEQKVEEGGEEAGKAESSKTKKQNPKSRKKKHHGGPSITHKAKRAKREKQNQVLFNNQSRPKALKNFIDRWSVERYKLAEENMLKIMKETGAVFGKPVLRPALRSEARKLIGDTGLLDHLLKHMSGKVAPGGTDRFRRRHNADGAMEYWLESADLVNIRRDAGVQDPYWTPPPGWKPGDNPTQDPICARELKQLKEEITKMKRDMQQLVSKKQEEEFAIVATLNSCVTSQKNLDYDGSLISLKEMYIELVNRKAKVEEQLMKISQSFREMEKQMERPKSTVGEQNKIVSAATPALLMGSTPAPPSGTESETEQVQQKNTAVTMNAIEQEEEKEGAGKATTPTATATAETENKAAKIERLKSGFRICKPQGTFLWPNMTMSPSPQVVVQLEDLLVVPTPPSVSSSSATSAPRSLPVGPHQPASPVKPLAERRAVTVTLSTASNNSLIDLNELPKNQNDSGFGGVHSHGHPAPSFTYQRRQHTVTTTTAMQHEKREDEEMVINSEQQQSGCTSAASSTSGLSMGVGKWLALATSNPFPG